MAGMWDQFKTNIGEAWNGTPEKFEPISMLNQAQQAGQGSILSSGLQQLQQPQQSLMDMFGPIEQKAITDYSQRIVPGLSSQFAGVGGGSGSSGFNQAMGGSGANLAENLAAMKAHIGMQQQQMNNSRMMSLLKMGMQPSQDITHYHGEPGLKNSFSEGAGQIIPILLEQYLKGGGGGNKLGELFGTGNPFGGGSNSANDSSNKQTWAQWLLGLLGRGLTGAAAGAPLGPLGMAAGGALGAGSKLLF